MIMESSYIVPFNVMLYVHVRTYITGYSPAWFTSLACDVIWQLQE